MRSSWWGRRHRKPRSFLDKFHVEADEVFAEDPDQSRHLVFGVDDRLEKIVSWKSGADVSKLSGKPVRLKFQLKDADLYSFQFQSKRSTP